MNLTEYEMKMLAGEYGPQKAKALDYIIQFGKAFGAKRLVDISYVHYPAEMAIYRGSVEDAVEYSKTYAKVSVPTTSSTLACDIEQWKKAGCPRDIFELQNQIIDAHKLMGIMGTYTCTPQFCGFVPPKGSYIVSVESSAIIYFNSVLGARTNRGGILTRYSAVTGKYPEMGYLLKENRKGTHLFKIELAKEDLSEDCDYSALGFHIGAIVGSEVPVIDYIGEPTQQSMLALGAALATSGSVSLFHAPPHTAEADTIEEAFHGCEPKEIHLVTKDHLLRAFSALTNIEEDEPIDFVTLGCPHYTLDQLMKIADWFNKTGSRVADGVNLWICTNRMTKNMARQEGVLQIIEERGGLVAADGCPVESHMRSSTCKEHGMKVPQCNAMVTDSAKMARYVGDLIGCKRALVSQTRSLEMACSGVFHSDRLV